MEDKVMVVTPVYCSEDNHRFPLLLQSVYCIANQSYSNLDHIIVDDGSESKFAEQMDMLASINPHIKVFHKDNAGSSAAVNYGVLKGISEDNYKYVTISHSDDILTLNSIESRVKAIGKDNSKFIYTDMIDFNDFSGNVNYKKAECFTSSLDLYESLKKHRSINYPTMFWDLRFFMDNVGGYDERITSGEDWDIALRNAKELVNNDFNFSVLNEVTAAYRFHGNNLGKKNLLDGTKIRCYEMILKKHYDGLDFSIVLCREAFTVVKSATKVIMREPLLFLRDDILKMEPTVLDINNEFLDSLRKLDYEGLLLSSDRN